MANQEKYLKKYENKNQKKCPGCGGEKCRVQGWEKKDLEKYSMRNIKRNI